MIAGAGRVLTVPISGAGRAETEVDPDMSATLFKPAHLTRMMNKAKAGKVFFAFTSDSEPRLIMDDEIEGKTLLAKLKKETGDKRGCGGTAWIESGVFMLQPDKPLPGLKTKFIEMAKEADLKVKKCKVLDAAGKPLDSSKDGSSFSEAADELLNDEEKVEQTRKLYAGTNDPAYVSLQKDLDAARRADEAGVSGGGAPAADAGPAAAPVGKAGAGGKGKPAAPAGTWDPREVADLGPSLYEQAKPYEIENPDVDIEIDPETGLDTAVAVSAGGGRKLKFSLPLKLKGKYLYVDGCDVTFEGTINLGKGKRGSDQGMGNTENKGGKGKSGASFKLSADNWKKEFAKGVAIKLKTTAELGILDGKTKFELSETFEAKAGILGFEIKAVAASYDESKDPDKRWEYLTVKPGGFVSGEWEMMLGGMPVVATGKASININIKVDWAEVSLELGRRKGAEWALEKLAERGAQAAVSGEAVAGAATAAETIETGMAAVTAAEAAVAATAVAGIALTAYAYFKSVEEIQGIKDAAKMAEELSNSFQNGYLAGFGIKVPAGGPLFDKGKETARAKFKIHLERAKARYKEKTGESLDEDQVKQLSLMMVDDVRKNETAFRSQVRGMFDHYIRSAALKAWKEKNKDEPNTAKNEKYVRTRMGLKDQGDLPVEPDWQFNPSQNRGRR